MFIATAILANSFSKLKCLIPYSVPLRDNYANQLREHIHIDEFGSCSGVHDECGQYNYECNAKLKLSYKFYLAFENTICDQ